MQKKDRETAPGAAWETVEGSLYGVLSLVTPEGAPDGVPLNFWRMGKDLYFHTARQGEKTRCLKNNSAVSIAFVREAGLSPERLTTLYSSAVVTGEAEEVTGPDERKACLRALCRHSGVREDHPALRTDFSGCFGETAVWRIRVREITGKAQH